jgi:hypothetical protein
MALPDFDRLLPKLPHGQRNPPLPIRAQPPKNVVPFCEVVRGVRNELKGTEGGAEFDQELERRGLLKDDQLQGKAAQE